MALKVGVVGLRGIGNHHAACHKADELANLVAVCDVVKARADEAAEKYKVKAYYSLKDMLDGEGTWTSLTWPPGASRTGAGTSSRPWRPWRPARTCWWKSPCPTTSARRARWCAKAAEKNVYLGCNLNHYFTPPAEKAREVHERRQDRRAGVLPAQDGLQRRRRDVRPSGLQPREGLAVLPREGVPVAPFSVMRHFCGDITHVRRSRTGPAFARRPAT